MELKKYQQDVVNEVRRNPSLRLILAMTGSGKSIIAKELVGDRLALVVTYASVVPQMCSWFPNSLVMSYNKFIMDKYLHGMVKEYVENARPVLVLDECQILRNPSNKICKILFKIKEFFSDIYMLSACAAPNDLHEYFSAAYLCGEFLGDNYNKFLYKYTKLTRGKEEIKNTGYNRKTYLAKGFKQEIVNREKLLNEISKFCIHVPDEDVLKEMPKQIFLKHEYKVPHIDYYRRVLEKEILTLEDRNIPLVNKLSVLTKLHQIESGFVYDDKKNIKKLSNAKIVSLRELLDSIGRYKCIIFTQFVHEMVSIMAELGVRSTNDANLFKTGRFQYLVGHPKSIGVGVSLEIAKYCIFYSHSFSYDDRLQSEGRIYRISQKSGNVFYYDMIPQEETITHIIMNSIKNKGNINEMVKEITSKRIIDSK